MGTRFEIVIADDGPDTRALGEEAIREIEDQHVRLTRFARDSLLAHINRTACRKPVRLDRATFQLFRTAHEVHLQSQGAFDIALGSGRVHLDEGDCSIQLEHPHTQLDLGAIAKGFALDRAAAILRAGGIRSALLHGGTSSVLAVGAPPDASAWRIGLAHTETLPYVDLCDGALAVSRPYSQLVDGKPHIRGGRAEIAVVTGPCACAADAWSTALAVMAKAPTDTPRGYAFHYE